MSISETHPSPMILNNDTTILQSNLYDMHTVNTEHFWNSLLSRTIVEIKSNNKTLHLQILFLQYSNFEWERVFFFIDVPHHCQSYFCIFLIYRLVVLLNNLELNNLKLNVYINLHNFQKSFSTFPQKNSMLRGWSGSLLLRFPKCGSQLFESVGVPNMIHTKEKKTHTNRIKIIKKKTFPFKMTIVKIKSFNEGFWVWSNFYAIPWRQICPLVQQTRKKGQFKKRVL